MSETKGRPSSNVHGVPALRGIQQLDAHKLPDNDQRGVPTATLGSHETLGIRSRDLSESSQRRTLLRLRASGISYVMVDRNDTILDEHEEHRGLYSTFACSA